jgi:hypothetical protein
MIDRKLLERLGWSSELIDAAVAVSERVESPAIRTLPSIPAIRSTNTSSVIADAADRRTANQLRR